MVDVFSVAQFRAPELLVYLESLIDFQTKTMSVSLCAVCVSYTYSAQRRLLPHTHTSLLQPLQMCRNP